MSSAINSPEQQHTSTTPIGLIVFAWALVGIPLLYGLFQTIKTASSLFG